MFKASGDRLYDFWIMFIACVGHWMAKRLCEKLLKRIHLKKKWKIWKVLIFVYIIYAILGITCTLLLLALADAIARTRGSVKTFNAVFVSAHIFSFLFFYYLYYRNPEFLFYTMDLESYDKSSWENEQTEQLTRKDADEEEGDGDVEGNPDRKDINSPKNGTDDLTIVQSSTALRVLTVFIWTMFLLRWLDISTLFHHENVVKRVSTSPVLD